MLDAQTLLSRGMYVYLYIYIYIYTMPDTTIPHHLCWNSGIPFKVEPEASSYPLGRLNCDPPVALLRSVMEHMAHVSAEMAKKGPGRPDFLLFTGDLVGIFVDDCFPRPLATPSRV